MTDDVRGNLLTDARNFLGKALADAKHGRELGRVYKRHDDDWLYSANFDGRQGAMKALQGSGDRRAATYLTTIDGVLHAVCKARDPRSNVTVAVSAPVKKKLLGGLKELGPPSEVTNPQVI